MFRPQIQKTKILVIMAIFSLILVYWNSISEDYIALPNISDKINATKIMSECIESIKKIEGNIIRNEDIYETGLLGDEKSSITSIVDLDQELLKSKVATTNPNFAALMVELFEEAGLGPGNRVAVSLTGSFPGANIAMLSACKALNITPYIISSISSSSWGANKDDLTWLDIENHLYQEGIFDYKSIASSIGGRNDIGENIRNIGIEIIEGKIDEYNIPLVNESTLKKNIQKKLEYYTNHVKEINDFDAFINIGGGAASLGKGEGKKFIKSGILSPLDDFEDIYFNKEYYKEYSVDFKNSLSYKFRKNEIVIINIKNISNLTETYESNYLMNPDQNSLNEGSLFYSTEHFNTSLIIFSLIILLIMVISVGVYSHMEIKKRMEEEEFDTVI